MKMKLIFVQRSITIVTILVSLAVLGGLFLTTANSYLHQDRATGGDYYNGLTYATFLAKEMPWPSSGWVHFWNEGMPVVGGYPLTTFYLMTPLLTWFNASRAMEVYGISSLFIFLLATFFLFRQAAKNTPVALGLTLITYITPATYYQLITEGFIVAGTMQWLLPLALVLLFRFIEKRSLKAFVMTALFCGIALLFHPAIGMLTVVAPVSLILFLHLITLGSIKSFIKFYLTFILLTFLVGITTVYPLVATLGKGPISGVCENPACWGEYPTHLNKWFTPITFVLFIAGCILAVMSKALWRNRVSIRLGLLSLGGMSILLLYNIAAYFHLINTIASALFPRRLFWAINIFVLLFVAFVIRSMYVRFNYRVGWILSTLCVVLLTGYYYLYPHTFTFKPTPYLSKPGAVPEYIDELTLPQYKKREIREIMPEWVEMLAASETNYRFDSANQLVNHWWNIFFTIPNTRGYSNSPTGDAADWQYFFQTATRDATYSDERILTNRALFMLDAYGIKLIDNAAASWPKTIIDNPDMVSKKDILIPGTPYLRDIQWYELVDSFASPIVAPITSPHITIIGDKPGYNTLLRIFANENINSRVAVPIKGPASLSTFSDIASPLVIAYQFKGINWDKLLRYIKDGGNLFIDTGSLPLLEKYPDIFPATTLKSYLAQGAWTKQPETANIVLKDIDVTQFAPLQFGGKPWKIQYVEQANLKENVIPLLYWENKAVLTLQNVGKGKVIWSGVNLPYHIVDSSNAAESKFFGNLVTSLLPLKQSEGTTSTRIARPLSNHVVVSGKDFTGIYFKENYHSGWKATVNGRSIPVLMGGLDFMYIPVPQAVNNKSQRVVLSFNGSITTWTLFILTIASFFVSVMYLIFPHPFHALKRHMHHHVKQKIGKRILTWWQREEE